MALKNMTYSLYSKIALWLVLNLVLLAVLGFGIGWYVLLGNGLVPAHFFSSNIENSFRLVSVNLQYRSVFTWQKLLKQYDRGEALRFHLRSLETGVLYDDCIPEKVIQAAMAIPKSSFTLCPDPDMQLWDSLRGGFFDTQQRNMEAGLPPIPPAIFVRTHSPARYWYGRVLYIPDKNHQLHYVLLALETDSFYGYGLFFEFRGVLLVILAVLGVSCLWWWPFVRHLSRPLLKMVHYAERVEMDNFVCLDKALSDTRTFSGERRDEIGRLGHAFMTMTRRVGLLISGQSQFIRHIAHELNSPLARTQIGLAILEERLEGTPRARAADHAGYQQAVHAHGRGSFLSPGQGVSGTPKNERIYLCPFLSSIVRSEAPEADVNVFADKDAWLWTDKATCAGRCATCCATPFIYAGEAGPIVVEVGGSMGKCAFRSATGGRARPNRICPCCWSLLPGQGVPDAFPAARGSACPSSNTAWKHVAGGSNTRTPNRRDFCVSLFFPKSKGPCSVKMCRAAALPFLFRFPITGTLRIKDWVRAKVFEGGGGEGGRRDFLEKVPPPLRFFLPRSPSGPSDCKGCLNNFLHRTAQSSYPVNISRLSCLQMNKGCQPCRSGRGVP